MWILLCSDIENFLTSNIYMVFSALVRIMCDFSRNYIYLGRDVYTKKFSYNLHDIFPKVSEEKAKNIFNKCFLGPYYAQGRVINKDSILKEDISCQNKKSIILQFFSIVLFTMSSFSHSSLYVSHYTL